MNRLALLALLAIAPVALASDVEYLVPVGPSQSAPDAYGARWNAAVVGYNFSRADIVPACDPACPAFHAQEALYWGSNTPNSAPVVLRIPEERVNELTLEETVNVVDPSMVHRSTHGFRLPLIRLDSLVARPLQFLNVTPNRFDSRTHLRVYSPLENDAERNVTVTIYRELEGRSSPIFSKSYSLSETISNGVRIAHGVIAWPDAAVRPPFPTRIEVTSDAPIWGFITVAERSETPAVSVILPAK
jgi:hypothetical protein